MTKMCQILCVRIYRPFSWFGVSQYMALRHTCNFNFLLEGFPVQYQTFPFLTDWHIFRISQFNQKYLTGITLIRLANFVLLKPF